MDVRNRTLGTLPKWFLERKLVCHGQWDAMQKIHLLDSPHRPKVPMR